MFLDKDYLPVPGASPYYKVQGNGPLLLILQGGDSYADGSAGLVIHLVDHYQVLTYDRRGLSRSKLNEGAEPPSIERHADDAHRLLTALSSEPALVVGFSIGALIGLDLVSIDLLRMSQALCSYYQMTSVSVLCWSMRRCSILIGVKV